MSYNSSNGVQITGNSNSIGEIKNIVTITDVSSPAVPDALLQELSDAQNRLADSETLIADAIGELREAIVKKDEKTIQQKIKALTSGTAAGVLKKVAGAAALRFLGLS